MKKRCTCVLFVSLLGIILAFLCLSASRVSAEVEIDLDELSTPTPAPAVKAAVVSAPEARSEAPRPTPETASPRTNDGTSADQTTEEKTVNGTEPTPDPIMVHGVLKMKDIYEAGIKAYKNLDYDGAIRYLTAAVRKIDPYTPKYFYAEAYAMLGIIYQFHLIHYQMAYDYYTAALKYEKNNRTAKRHIGEVAKLIHQRKSDD